MFKLIVTDLDGTLLNNAHKVSPRTIVVIKQLKTQGVKFSLATGRHFEDVKHVASQLGDDMYLITSNGAQIHNQSGELLYNQCIDQRLVKQVLGLSAVWPVHSNVYQYNNWLVELPSERLRAMHPDSGFVYQQSNFNEIGHDGVTKLFFIGDEEILTVLKKQILATAGEQLNVIFSLSDCLEVMAKGVSKAAALKIILKEEGIDACRVIAFGDGINDIDVLNLVSHPVVMKNSSEQLKAQFSHAAEAFSCEQDGVAIYLEHLL